MNNISFFKMTVREFADIKNGSVATLSDNTKDNLVVKVSGTNVIMFCGKESFVIGSTETETDKTLVDSINTMLRVYLRSQYDWEHITEYDWGYQFEENEEIISEERKEVTLVKNTIIEVLKNPIFHTYNDYWDTDKRFEGWFDFAGDTFSITIDFDDESGDETYLTVDTEYSSNFTEIYEDTTADEIKDFIAREIAESIYTLIKDN